MTGNSRTETDSLGAVEVPNNVYYGAQAERARRNFPISGIRMPRRFLAAMARIKAEAARVNVRLGVVDREIGDAIIASAEELHDALKAGERDADFPVDIFQTGSGTSSNMNVNEVIANRAIERLGGTMGSKSPVHPNDHVNASQSSNDTVPTAIHVAAYIAAEEVLRPGLVRLQTALANKARELDDVVKIGRTHLQDAVPIRLGQEFSGYAQQIENGIDRLDGALPRIAQLALGGTAVGTGLNAPDGFAIGVIEGLAKSTGHPFVPASNRFEAMAAKDAAVELSGVLKTIAVSMTKIGNDIRWLASGPRCGLGEITIPSLQPGSSIMPGKVNPVIPEAVLMVGAQVVGNDVTISWSGAAGNFELNVMMPVIAHNLLQSVEVLGNAASVFAERCVEGIQPQRERAEEMVEKSLAMVTALAPRIGYDDAAAIAKESVKTGRTVREIAVDREVLPLSELEELLDPRGQTE